MASGAADPVQQLDALLQAGRFKELETLARQMLAEKRFFVWHQYLIVALLRTGRREEAAKELDTLFSYKFNIDARAWPEIREAFPEKFEGHFIMNTMKPETSFEAAPLVSSKWIIPAPIADRATFESVVDAFIGRAMPALPAVPRESTPVTTFGSCFAANLAKFLKAGGIDASNLLIEESINSPYANRELLNGVISPETAEHSQRLLATFGAEFLTRVRERLSSAKVIVMTLGVAPLFFFKDTDRPAFLEDYRALLSQGKLYMRTPAVAEVKETISEILALLRKLNPAARIYMTVSPVPLLGTAEFTDAMIADTISKSSLRVAVHEVLSEEKPRDVYYWPSFEIVRWLGGHTSLEVFGADDKNSRHVSDWVVQLIVDRFSKHLFAEARAQAAAAGPASIKGSVQKSPWQA